MNKLTRLTPASGPPRVRAGAHAFRIVAGKVLITNDLGRRAFLTPVEYRVFLAGKLPEGALKAELGEGGFLGGTGQDSNGREWARALGLSWEGPRRHVLVLAQAQRRMSLETARAVVDFIFAGPRGPLMIEIVVPPRAGSWATAWFIAEYSRRKGEWYGRKLRVTARLTREWEPRRASKLENSGVELRETESIDGAPGESRSGSSSRRLSDPGVSGEGVRPPSAMGRRLLADVGAGAREPRAWVDTWAAAGRPGVRLKPSPPPTTPGGIAAFVGFYSGALDRMLEHAATGGPLLEEWTAGVLGGAGWEREGMDVAGELAYDPGGRVFSSEQGLEAAAGGEDLLLLGSVGDLRFRDLARSPAVRASLAAAWLYHQPLCCQCAYKPYCAPAPSLSLRLQGTVWGQTPASPVCSLQMALLDEVFKRLAREDLRPLLEDWAKRAV